MSAAGTVTQRGPTSWQIKVQRGTRQHTRTVRASSRREASKLAAAFVTEIDGGTVATAPAKLTVDSFLADWVEGANVRELTRVMYRSTIRCQLAPALGRYKLKELSATHIKAAFVQWAASGLAPSTLRKIKMVLSSALASAERYDMISRNPMARLKGELPVGEPPEAVPVSADKIAELLQDDGSPYSIAVMLAVAGGLRRGECLGLRWRSVNLDAGTVDIVEQYGPLGFAPPKSADSERTIRLPAEAIDRLRAHRAATRERLLARGIRMTPDTTVACDDRGEPLQPGAFSSWCGRRGFKAHNLRHAVLTALVSSGQMPLADVAKFAGHSSPVVTLNIYSHAAAAGQEAAAQVIGERMFR